MIVVDSSIRERVTAMPGALARRGAGAEADDESGAAEAEHGIDLGDIDLEAPLNVERCATVISMRGCSPFGFPAW